MEESGPIKSKALEVNLACSRVDVSIEERFLVLQELISDYAGLVEGSYPFLCELSHPLKNWRFIVDEARGYGLKHLHLLRQKPQGPQAARILVDIFLEAALTSKDEKIRSDALDNLLDFLQRLTKDLAPGRNGFSSTLEYSFSRMLDLPLQVFFFLVSSFYQLDKTVRLVQENGGQGVDRELLARLLIRYYRQTYLYWLQEDDPLEWMEKETGLRLDHKELKDKFESVSHRSVRHYLSLLDSVGRDHIPDELEALLALPGYRYWVATYREISQLLGRVSPQEGGGLHRKVIFLFRIMEIKGLARIHEETLREINRSMTRLIKEEDKETLKGLLEKTFRILKLSSERYPQTALECIHRMGQGIYSTGDFELLDFFMDRAVSFGFQYPRISGVTDEWQVVANEAHLKNIRVWLDLIKLNPKWSKKLLSALVINLSLGGIFIKDTDLFPRDVTELLNAEIEPVYNLIKQLTRLFPVYFNEIGAEGELRDISTDMDELYGRKDVLVHFLRKQSHVESSNLIVSLTEETLNFWYTLDKEPLRPLLPPSVFDQIQAQGPYVEGAHKLISALFRHSRLNRVPDLLHLQDDIIKEWLHAVAGVSDTEKQRVWLVIRLYKLLYQKYNLGFQYYEEQLKPYQAMGFPRMRQLLKALHRHNVAERLDGVLKYLEVLKDIILSEERYAVVEDIYRKRHIAVDIPSMYGQYHERKFDALGLSFRLENLVKVMLEELVSGINLNIITQATFFQIYDCLKLFQRALNLEGITSGEMERQMDLLSHALQVRHFTLSQYIDIFKGFSEAVKKIVDVYYHRIHAENLKNILAHTDPADLLPKYVKDMGSHERPELEQAVSERFLRHIISDSLGLQSLDVFIGRILNTLFFQAEKLPGPQIHLLLSYDPQKAICPIYKPNRLARDIIHLGNKGLNLVRLAALGYPVPPGFIITTEVFRCRKIVEEYEAAGNDFKERVMREIKALEKRTRSRFGDPSNPLLLSVRSGAAVSQPGMMESYLNVGINRQVVEGLVKKTGNGWFAWDNYRRFLQSWGMSHGIERDYFDAIIGEFKRLKGVAYKRDFSDSEMREVALAYRDLLKEKGISLEDDPVNQLHVAIGMVLNSWYSPKARTYRKIMGISDNWGTAVVVQRMVFGNLSRQSGAGVFFTHSPVLAGDKIRLWGDFSLGNQGEDVVAGLVRTLPITRTQAQLEERRSAPSLQELFPELYAFMREMAKDLIYNHRWGPQELEFTFEGPRRSDFYVLQTRDMVLRERKTEPVFDLAASLEKRPLCRGIGVSGGALSGRAVFTLEEINYWRNKEPGTPLILIRSDTVPDDIKEISAADGLLTSRGGSTSHASIVAYRLGKTCVVGCARLNCYEQEKYCTIEQHRITTGDRISIDGRSGEIYWGEMEIKQ